VDPSIIEIREFSLENVLNQKFYGQRKEIPREVAIALLVAAGGFLGYSMMNPLTSFLR
jgi:hypothetical protein